MSKTSRSRPSRGAARDEDVKIDWRLPLYNEEISGPIQDVQLPVEMITSLRGILLDFDPQLFRADVINPDILGNPRLFYEEVVGPMLGHHPLTSISEVRISGLGVHAVIYFKYPIQFKIASNRQRWSGIIKAIQRLFPTDPDCPGITATTRPLGSVNGKNGVKVTKLRDGFCVEAAEIIDLFELAKSKPFRTVCQFMYGSERCDPCPICMIPGRTLDALDRVGRCYGGCGTVQLGQLYDGLLKPREPAKNT